MGRSQRHKVIQQNASSRGYIWDEGGLAPAALKQGAGPYAVPVGAPGGPLSGSPLMGAFPAGFVQPTPHEDMQQLPAPRRQLPAPEGGERIFPIGPFALIRIEPGRGRGSYLVVGGSDIRAGDTVRIEATGSSAANGDYVVGDVSTDTGEGAYGVLFTVPSEVAATIEGKGRVTVLSGD
jgi:hypothetical protein